MKIMKRLTMFVASKDSVPPAKIVQTPTGDEIIVSDECEEVTHVYPAGTFERFRADASAHNHGTVRAMKRVRT